jgi:uncharacterized cupin superfamily protein
MNKPLINIVEVTHADWEHGKKYKAKLGNIGRALGSQHLGYSIIILPPGKAAFPFHNHRVNEEMFFILEGTGQLRLGSATHKIKKGDVIAAPPGNRSTAHQIINTSKKQLKYLAVSTKSSPEIAEYPDSNKIGVLAEFPAGSKKSEWFYIITKNKSAGPSDYWEGE